MKLKNRINLYTAVLFIILLFVINGAIYFTFSKMMLNSELERTTAEAEQVIAGVNGASSSIPTTELLRAYVPINGMLQIVRAEGKRGAAATAPSQQKLRDLPVTFYQKEVKKILEYDGVPHVFVSLPIVWKNGEVAELQVTENLNPVAEMLGILKIVLILVTILAMIPVFISSRLLSNFISRPITSMIKTMREIQTSGEFKRISMPKESKDELYLMGETFNNMMNLLEVNYERQGQFISNASHELKTPITIIESYASLLKRRGREQPELFDESVQAIHSEAIRMKNLTQQLLLLAKQDEQWNVQKENLPLTKMVKEMVRSFQNAYNREIDLDIKEDIYVWTDQQKFKQLFYILMDNARKYSEDTIEVRISKFNEKAIIEIIDYGIGIPADQLDKIFDRFYRVDQARTRKTGGFGLGLSLAKEIAEVMGAKIEIKSQEGHGTTARMLFLLANPH